MVQSEFYEATRILFVCKENKNNNIYSTICLLSVSVVPFWRASDGRKVRTLFSVISNAWICCFRSNQSVNKRTIHIHALLIQIGPLMADGLSWRCFLYFFVPWQCNLLGSQWDSHKPPSFHLKYLKLCSEDRRSFTGLEWHGDKVINDKIFILGWSTQHANMQLFTSQEVNWWTEDYLWLIGCFYQLFGLSFWRHHSLQGSIGEQVI